MGNRLTGGGVILTLATALILALTFTSALAKKPEGTGKDRGTRLCVTFRDSNIPPDRVTSLDSDVTGDRGGLYCDDDPDVGLVTLSAGDQFIFSTSGLKTLPRQIGLDFSDCAENCDDRDFDDVVSTASFQFLSDSHTDLTDPRFLTGALVGLRLHFTLSGESKITRTINFGPKNESWACPGDNGNPVTVTFSSVSGCWEMEAGDEACLTKSNSRAGGSGKRGSGVEPQGTYHMPFLLMLCPIP